MRALPAQTRRPAAPLLLAALLALAAAAAYWPSLRHDFFVMDDFQMIHDNPMVASGLSWAGAARALRPYASNWIPLTWLSLMLDVRLFGLDPRGFHAVNLLLHAADSALLFLALWAMTGARWRSALAAALFALHPLHVESVAWVAERKDVLCSLFWMTTLLLWTRHVRRPGRGAYLLALAAFALALSAKPMAVSLPLVLVVLDVWPLGRTPSWRLAAEKIPFFALSILSSAATLYAQSGGGSLMPAARWSLGERLANASAGYWAYLAKAVWPAGLAVFYPLRPVSALHASAAAGLLAAATFLFLRQRRGRPWLAAGWLWYLLTLLPVSGLVQVGEQAMADRYAYLPLIGPFLMLAWGLGELAERSPAGPRPVAALACAALAALSVATRRQLAYWKDSESLLKRTLAVTGPNAFTRYNLGVLYARQGRLAEAVAEFREVLSRRGQDPAALAALGSALSERGEGREALERLEEARSLRDGAVVRNELGLALVRLGRREEAEAHFRKALELEPGDPAARTNLGASLAERGKTAEAEAEFLEALRQSPGFPQAEANLKALRAMR